MIIYTLHSNAQFIQYYNSHSIMHRFPIVNLLFKIKFKTLKRQPIIGHYSIIRQTQSKPEIHKKGDYAQ